MFLSSPRERIRVLHALIERHLQTTAERNAAPAVSFVLLANRDQFVYNSYHVSPVWVKRGS